MTTRVDRWGKLGSTALIAAAMSCPSLCDYRVDEREKSFVSSEAEQGADGLFDCFYGLSKDPGKVINFYPGEALLALALRAEQRDLSSANVFETAVDSP